ncbi:hypothetical protein [Pontibacter liquoris]|uniref:hypothetical protein n=1 Tax=Pontibacter liquoris TaxID=2905677 RepID=UPI001FA8002E|nr:hypothetical protein [Pontibacter liquoris]
MRTIQQLAISFCILGAVGLSGCQTGNAPASTATTANAAHKSLAPNRVDIRGAIITRHYDQGQVMLEIEGFPSPDSRYNRAYVLVLPTTQIINSDGQTISLSELSQGQNVAVLLRSGGHGNMVGIGIARKLWVEEL